MSYCSLIALILPVILLTHPDIM